MNKSSDGTVRLSVGVARGRGQCVSDSAPGPVRKISKKFIYHGRRNSPERVISSTVVESAIAE